MMGLCDDGALQSERLQGVSRPLSGIRLALHPGGVTAPWRARPPLGSGKRLRLSGRSQLSWELTENKL